ncbi:MAG: tetratricopeptide repeat protein [Thalassotalea sp.]
MKSLFAIGLLISSTTFANQAEIDSIELASMQLNSPALMQATLNNQGYIKALAFYRLSVSQNIKTNQQAAIKSLNSAISELEHAITLDPNDDESWALLSQCYGFKTIFEPQNVTILGPQANKALAKAEKLDPNNPRVMLFKGIISFNTPAIYGGSKTAAITSLNKAIELFADDKSSGSSWGEAEAYIWRGLSYQATQQNDQAVSDFEHALAIAPDFGWAKMLLTNNPS